MDVYYFYEDKYYVFGLFCCDGFFVFGLNYCWGNFWFVGGKWCVSGEEFFKDNFIIINVIFWVFYGIVGN